MNKSNQKQVIGFYSLPEIKQVSPLRTSIINEFQKDIKLGKITKADIPKFKRVFKSGLTSSGIAKSTKIDQDDYAYHLKQTPFHENPYFKEVYQAMKQVRQELSDSIEKQRKVYFESEPIDFIRSDERDEVVRNG